jgi:hypothetical protein
VATQQHLELSVFLGIQKFCFLALLPAELVVVVATTTVAAAAAAVLFS